LANRCVYLIDALCLFGRRSGDLAYQIGRLADASYDFTKYVSDFFRNFYARRVVRIFPLYYLMLFLVFGVYTDIS